MLGAPPKPRGRRGRRSYRTRVSVAVGAIGLLLVSLPFVPAVAGVGGSTIRYAYQPRLTPDIVGPVPRHHAGARQALHVAGPAEPVSG